MLSVQMTTHVQILVVEMWAIRVMMVSQSTSGSACHLELMNENKRCSTLFHLLVPGGEWHTQTGKPSSLASACNSHCHSRAPLLPPLSHVISNRLALGYSWRPSSRHQPRIEATRKGGRVVIGADADKASRAAILHHHLTPYVWSKG